MNKRAIRWNDLIDEYIIKKRRAGASYGSIASALGCAKEGVRRRFLLICGAA